jgi:hypothetical protein
MSADRKTLVAAVSLNCTDGSSLIRYLVHLVGRAIAAVTGAMAADQTYTAVYSKCMAQRDLRLSAS